MAYRVRHRAPLLDSTTREFLEQRGKELVGLALIGAGICMGVILGTYSPDDPGWFSATGAPASNWMGHTGASIASPIYIVIGLGGWGIAALLAAWGLRFVGHWGEERAIGRLIFAPAGIALVSVYASTLPEMPGWGKGFGMGGLFGDAFSAAVLSVLQEWGGLALWLKILSAVSFIAAAATMLFAMGFSRAELVRISLFPLIGLILSYAAIMRLVGFGASGALRLARRIAAARLARKEAARQFGESDAARQSAGTPSVVRTEPVITRDAGQDENLGHPIPVPSGAAGENGILGAIFGRRTKSQAPLHDEESDGTARIRARIGEAIQARVRRPRTIPELARTEPTIGPAVPDRDAEPPAAEDGDSAPEPDGTETRPAYVRQSAETERGAEWRTHPNTLTRRKKAGTQPAAPKAGDGTREYKRPPLSLLTDPSRIERHHPPDEALEENAHVLETVLDDYGVKGEIVSVRPGPVVTMYELEPAPGLKASRVIGLADDIARSMSALSARVSTVAGRSVIGIELPNEKREIVLLREILAGRAFRGDNQRLPLALGKDISGEPVVANLSKMPHLLIAGTTGSGKSVAINTMILSLLYRLTPDECRMIMIDPKMLELSVYDGIPHLLSPVVTDPKKAVVALKWVVGEMEERYRKMSKLGVRNIDGYNGRVREALAKDETFSRTVQTGFDEETGNPVFETEEFAPEAMPFIVVIVDEMADLMMVAGKEIEACIQRLAQMARASGIHLIMATQRPSVDVITGTIKANFPTRISFQVTSKIDSRTILGEMGAEQLLGMGDMLYMAGGGRIARVHGPFCSDEEVEEVVNHLKAYGPPEYVGSVVEGPDEDKESDIDMVLGLGGNTDGEDALYDRAVAIVIEDRKCSTSYIQRKLAIGYNKAARLVEQMEKQGLVSTANHVGKREILVPEQG